MSTLSATASPSTLERQLIEGIQFALEDLARSLVARVTELVQEQLHGTRMSASKSRQALAEAVASQMPTMLEQEFMARLLGNDPSARQHRAVLSHVLSAAEVQAVGAEFSPLRLPPPQSHERNRPDEASTPPAADAEQAEELTSEAAAKLLHVSRTHLNTLADTGALGRIRRTEGGHRRLLKAHVLRYLAETQDRQLQGLDQMIAATDALGMYEEEAKVLRPQRSRRR
ncbi:helix-turn-helix domain-containing protein [Roseateles terrae]|nr:helix-turn-helix domain-containing protein [Roseateles terrae]